MKFKIRLSVLITVIFILSLASTVFTQDLTHNVSYHLDGDIDLEKQVGHLCNTGAEMKQTIIGEGIIQKLMDSTLVAGKLIVKDSQDWVTAEGAVRNLTVTSRIELCMPAKHEYTTTLYVPLAAESVVTSVTVAGAESITVPVLGAAEVIETYTATVFDQYGAPLPGEGVSWSLETAVTGVSIDEATSVVTVTDEAGAGAFTVVATSVTDPSVSGSLTVSLVLADSVVTSVTVTGAESITVPALGAAEVTETYTATVFDQYGVPLPGEGVSWSLETAVTGVSIDEATGVVTVTDEAGAGAFTVVATSVTDPSASGSLTVRLVLADSVVTSVTVTGADEIEIPTLEEVIINGSFETGDFTGWSLTGPVEKHLVVSSYTSYEGTIYEPVEGSFFAVLTSGGLGEGVYNIISQEITISAGDYITGYAAFDTTDYMPFNDDAAIVIINSMGEEETIWEESVSSVGDFGETPWTFWSWTAPEDGVYTLELRVRNIGDDGVDSTALFDFISTTVEDEPATETYTATVFDQYGAPMPGEAVSWSLAAAVAGVSIDEATGVVTVTDEASAGTFTVVVTSVTDPGVSGSLVVILVDTT
ncbi:MAG: hypothetical protein ACQES4_10690 [Bacillota bacterium]